MLDWLVPSICRSSPEYVQWADEDGSASAGYQPLFRVHTYDRATTDDWQVPKAAADEKNETLQRVADLQPVEESEVSGVGEQVENLLNILDSEYAAEALTTMPARVAVSELKRRWDTTRQPEDFPLPDKHNAWQPSQPGFLQQTRQQDAAERGTATHRFLQHLDFQRPCDQDDLQQQLSDLIETGHLSGEDAEGIMLDAVAWFFTTALGQRIRENATQTRREVAFISRIKPEQYEAGVTACEPRDVLLVRGMIDLVLDHEDSLEILDYKTDTVDPDQCAARAESYRLQLELYARALSDICQRPVNAQWLVFLHARQIVHLPARGN
jgi:ATP-dependent helicase/nuclease subunit A